MHRGGRQVERGVVSQEPCVVRFTVGQAPDAVVVARPVREAPACRSEPQTRRADDVGEKPVQSHEKPAQTIGVDVRQPASPRFEMRAQRVFAGSGSREPQRPLGRPVQDEPGRQEALLSAPFHPLDHLIENAAERGDSIEVASCIFYVVDPVHVDHEVGQLDLHAGEWIDRAIVEQEPRAFAMVQHEPFERPGGEPPVRPQGGQVMAAQHGELAAYPARFTRGEGGGVVVEAAAVPTDAPSLEQVSLGEEHRSPQGRQDRDTGEVEIESTMAGDGACGRRTRRRSAGAPPWPPASRELGFGQPDGHERAVQTHTVILPCPARGPERGE